MGSMLEVHGLSKRFPGVQALDRVDFDVDAGEVVGLIGENGAGKSTLIKVLAGVHRADEGQVLLNGEPVGIHTPQDSFSLGISVIFQELNLVGNLSVAENIFLGRELRSPGVLRSFLDFGRTTQRAQQLMQQAGLNCDPRLAVEELSLSHKQMVEVAKALSINSKIIIMDEPTSTLTGQETELLFQIIERLKSSGVAVVFVSHKLDEVFRICDRLHVLRDGRHVGALQTARTSRDELIRLMVGRDLGTLFVKQEAQISDTVLEVRDLGSPKGIEHVSFDLHRGEILGFAGLVGSGRTEVMRALFGIDKRTSGEILIDGRPVSIHSPSDAIAHGIGFVPEDRQVQGLVLGMDVRQNVTLASLQAVSERGFLIDAREQGVTGSFIEKLSIRTPSQEQIVVNLSGGNQQKVVVSKWLATNPRILILDEPTRGIDVGAKKEIHRLMSQLACQNVAIIMISSELSEILAMSDRIVVMHEGRKKGELDRAQASQEKIMEIALRQTDQGVA
ncbi:MAG: sugar ABC transporter ATP-binding protein [Spirochaetaceae bacterium]|nr:MAG: sugar ABC transporter ATP-binding protein [Spirochaetaceae bacterium]